MLLKFYHLSTSTHVHLKISFFFQVFLVAAAFDTKTCKNNVLREIQKRYYAKSGDFYISLLFLPHSNITTLVLLNKDKRKALTL